MDAYGFYLQDESSLQDSELQDSIQQHIPEIIYDRNITSAKIDKSASSTVKIKQIQKQFDSSIASKTVQFKNDTVLTKIQKDLNLNIIEQQQEPKSQQKDEEHKEDNKTQMKSESNKIRVSKQQILSLLRDYKKTNKDLQQAIDEHVERVQNNKTYEGDGWMYAKDPHSDFETLIKENCDLKSTINLQTQEIKLIKMQLRKNANNQHQQADNNKQRQTLKSVNPVQKQEIQDENEDIKDQLIKCKQLINRLQNDYKLERKQLLQQITMLEQNLSAKDQQLVLQQTINSNNNNKQTAAKPHIAYDKNQLILPKDTASGVIIQTTTETIDSNSNPSTLRLKIQSQKQIISALKSELEERNEKCNKIKEKYETLMESKKYAQIEKLTQVIQQKENTIEQQKYEMTLEAQIYKQIPSYSLCIIPCLNALIEIQNHPLGKFSKFIKQFEFIYDKLEIYAKFLHSWAKAQFKYFRSKFDQKFHPSTQTIVKATMEAWKNHPPIVIQEMQKYELIIKNLTKHNEELVQQLKQAEQRMDIVKNDYNQIKDLFEINVQELTESLRKHSSNQISCYISSEEARSEQSLTGLQVISMYKSLLERYRFIDSNILDEYLQDQKDKAEELIRQNLIEKEAENKLKKNKQKKKKKQISNAQQEKEKTGKIKLINKKESQECDKIK